MYIKIAEIIDSLPILFIFRGERKIQPHIQTEHIFIIHVQNAIA